MLRARGFTLPEVLVVAAILGITASAVLPSLTFNEASELSVGASEAGNALRMARSEAIRSGRSVLVDAGSAAGRIKLLYADCTATGSFPAVVDPVTRNAADVAVADGNFSNGVQLTPTFLVGGTAYSGVVFDASGAAVQACDIATMLPKGVPQAGSGIVVGSAGKSLLVALDAATGRVSWP
jgi:prepilin-type N-terminal cleavage/methylation domain-containing protein